MLAKNITNPNS